MTRRPSSGCRFLSTRSAFLQSAQHPAQGPLGQTAVLGELSRLPLPPDPENEEDGETAPGQALGRKDLALHSVADRIGRPVDVGHGKHRLEVEGPVAEPGPDVPFSLQHYFRIVVS